MSSPCFSRSFMRRATAAASLFPLAMAPSSSVALTIRALRPSKSSKKSSFFGNNRTRPTWVRRHAMSTHRRVTVQRTDDEETRAGMLECTRTRLEKIASPTTPRQRRTPWADWPYLQARELWQVRRSRRDRQVRELRAARLGAWPSPVSRPWRARWARAAAAVATRPRTAAAARRPPRPAARRRRAPPPAAAAAAAPPGRAESRAAAVSPRRAAPAAAAPCPRDRRQAVPPAAERRAAARPAAALRGEPPLVAPAPADTSVAAGSRAAAVPRPQAAAARTRAAPPAAAAAPARAAPRTCPPRPAPAAARRRRR